MTGVYKILNVINDKFYIGSSVNVEGRWKAHINELNNGIHNNKHLQNAWNKYGQDNFKFELLEEVSKEHLRERETFYLQSTNCTNPDIGYNLLDNANIGLGVHASKIVRKKISDACKGEKNGHYGKHHSEEIRLQISLKKQQANEKRQQQKFLKWLSEEHICENCGSVMTSVYGSGRFCNKVCQSQYQSKLTKGIPHTYEHNLKVSQALKGKKFSEEHCAKLSKVAKERMTDKRNNPMYGKHHSAETKAHWSEIRKGVRNSSGFTGKHHSEETRKKISESLRQTRLRRKELNDDSQ